VSAELLGHQAQGKVTRRHAPVGFRYARGRQTHLYQTLPHVSGIRRFTFKNLADNARGAAIAEQARRLIAYQFLVFGKVKIQRATS
jgi:hypothetical protein